jgi:hypothetical protein
MKNEKKILIWKNVCEHVMPTEGFNYLKNTQVGI